jgi:hypothetical protein
MFSQTYIETDAVCNTCDLMQVLRNTFSTLKTTAEQFPNIILTDRNLDKCINRAVLLQLQQFSEMVVWTLEMLKRSTDCSKVTSLYDISLQLQSFFDKQFLEFDDVNAALVELRELVFEFEETVVTISHCLVGKLIHEQNLTIDERIQNIRYGSVESEVTSSTSFSTNWPHSSTLDTGDLPFQAQKCTQALNQGTLEDGLRLTTNFIPHHGTDVSVDPLTLCSEF